MSTIHIPDNLLADAGISEAEALIELACGLFESGKLSLFLAAKLARMTQHAFEEVLLERGIPIYKVDAADLREDLSALSDKRAK